MIDTLEILNSEFNKNNLQININNSQKKAKLILDKKLNYIYPINKNEKKFSSSIYLLENTKAPINSNSKLGVMKLIFNGITLYEVDILSEDYIPEISYFQYLDKVIKNIKYQFSN